MFEGLRLLKFLEVLKQMNRFRSTKELGINAHIAGNELLPFASSEAIGAILLPPATTGFTTEQPITVADRELQAHAHRAGGNQEKRLPAMPSEINDFT